MWLVVRAMRRPFTAAVAVVAIVLAAGRAIRRMPADIFRARRSGDLRRAAVRRMDPAQMEGFLTYFFEYHFLYITGIEHVELRTSRAPR